MSSRRRAILPPSTKKNARVGAAGSPDLRLCNRCAGLMTAKSGLAAEGLADAGEVVPAVPQRMVFDDELCGDRCAVA